MIVSRCGWTSLRISFITHAHSHLHTKLSLCLSGCIHINHYCLISVTYHPCLSRVCSSQSDLGVAVLRTAKLSYYISSARLAAAPQSPDLAPDCTEQHWHHFIPPTSICCDSNQSFASYFSHPCMYFPLTDSCTNLSVYFLKVRARNTHLCGLGHYLCKYMHISGRLGEKSTLNPKHHVPFCWWMKYQWSINYKIISIAKQSGNKIII